MNLEREKTNNKKILIFKENWATQVNNLFNYKVFKLLFF